MNCNSLRHFLATGELTPTMDCGGVVYGGIGGCGGGGPTFGSCGVGINSFGYGCSGLPVSSTSPTSLEKHDRRFHPHGFDPKKDHCEFRDRQKHNDKSDMIREDNADSRMKDDYASLISIRGILEPVARLLNGRAGNLRGLQASGRWEALRHVARDTEMMARLSEIRSHRDSKAIHKYAKELQKVHDGIMRSAKHDWNDSVGKVPSESEIKWAIEEEGKVELPSPERHSEYNWGSCGRRCG